MKRTSLILSIALAGTIIVGGGLDLGAQERKAYTSKSKSTPLIKTAVVGVAGKEVNIVRFALPSGFTGGRHSHPGQVFVYILEGSLNMEIEGNAPRKLEAGDVFQEPQGRTMRVRNLSTTDGVKFIVFQIGDAGKPLMIKAK